MRAADAAARSECSYSGPLSNADIAVLVWVHKVRRVRTGVSGVGLLPRIDGLGFPAGIDHGDVLTWPCASGHANARQFRRLPRLGTISSIAGRCPAGTRLPNGDDVAWHAYGDLMIVVVLPATKPPKVRP